VSVDGFGIPYYRMAAEEMSFHLTQGDTGQFAREAIAKGDFPRWDVFVQIMTEADAAQPSPARGRSQSSMKNAAIVSTAALAVLSLVASARAQNVEQPRVGLPPLQYNFAQQFPLHNRFLTRYVHVYRSSVRDLLRCGVCR
jgi:hypothetical protein